MISFRPPPRMQPYMPPGAPVVADDPPPASAEPVATIVQPEAASKPRGWPKGKPRKPRPAEQDID